MNRLDYIGTRNDQMIITAFQRFPAEVLGREVEALDARAHRAIVDEDAFFQSSEVGRVDRLSGHACYLYEKSPRVGAGLKRFSGIFNVAASCSKSPRTRNICCTIANRG